MNIYESINKVMSEIGAISKEQVNQVQKFKFRGIDDVMNALHPLLAKNKVFVVPNILEQLREERATKSGGNLIYSVCKVQYTFFAEDGTSIQASVIGEGMDSGDKATNKAMAIAFKYALFQVFCIPTEEIKDPDADTPETSTVKTKKISDKKINTLYEIAKNVGYEPTKVVEVILKKYKCKPADMTEEQYKEVCEGYSSLKTK